MLKKHQHHRRTKVWRTEINVQLNDGDRKGALGQLAAPHSVVRESLRGPAPVADVPRDGARAQRVVVVGPHLAVDADRVQGGHGSAEDDADDRGPDAHDEADELGDEDEEGEYGDGDIEVCESSWDKVNHVSHRLLSKSRQETFAECSSRAISCLRLGPHQGQFRSRFMVRLGVEEDSRVRVEAPDVPDAPELRAEQVWLRDAEEDQQRDGAGQLEWHYPEHGGPLPPCPLEGLIAPVPLRVPS